jgi:hypothetical protein
MPRLPRAVQLPRAGRSNQFVTIGSSMLPIAAHQLAERAEFGRSQS